MLFVKSVTRSASTLVSAVSAHSDHSFTSVTSIKPIKRIAATVIGLVGLSLLAVQVAPVQTASAAPSFAYQVGYSVQHGWLCYGWENGTLHCTSHWHTSNGAYVSDNAAWVPSSASRSSASNNASSANSLGLGAGAIAGISQWAKTGRASFGMSDYAGDPYSGSFGQCTWWANYKNSWQHLAGLGNAGSWASSARARGLSTGSSAAVGATVVFQPGVQGAGGAGHVGHVEAVYSGGWFLLSEMNFYWNGGGWGRVDYRYAHTGAGVSFIYA